MGYKMNRNAASPFNFGEGTGRSPLNNGEKKAGVVARTWDNPKGDHIDKQVKNNNKKHHPINETASPGPSTTKEVASDNRQNSSARPEMSADMKKKSSEKEPPSSSPTLKTSPLNQVRGQQQMNPSVEVPHVEHGTGRGSRTGKGIKHSHTI
tara:strand:- start:126 stop:581 length:456 start_codon:yes stop_codon:yes gene_type:complete